MSENPTEELEQTKSSEPAPTVEGGLQHDDQPSTEIEPIKKVAKPVPARAKVTSSDLDADLTLAKLFGRLPGDLQQSVFDSVISAVRNNKPRDFILNLLFWKVYKGLRDNQLAKPSPTSDSDDVDLLLSKHVLSLPSSVLQVIFDSLNAALHNLQIQDSALHIALWKTWKHLRENLPDEIQALALNG